MFSEEWTLRQSDWLFPWLYITLHVAYMYAYAYHSYREFTSDNEKCVFLDLSEQKR